VSGIVCFGVGSFTLWQDFAAKGKWKDRAFRLRVWQLLAAIYGIFFWSFILGEYFHNWDGQLSACQAIPKARIVMYIFFKQAINLFLYERAAIVHESLHLQSKWLRYLRWSIWLSLVGFVPGFIWSPFVAFDSLILPDGSCMVVMVVVWVTFLFSVGDFLLGMSLLAIFVIPFHAHLRYIGGQGTDSNISGTMQKVIRKNFIYSSIISLVGLIANLSFTVVYSLDWENNIHWAVWAFSMIVFDTVINLLGVHLLSTAWAGKTLSRMLYSNRSYESSTHKSQIPTGGAGSRKIAVVSSETSSPQQKHHVSIRNATSNDE